MMNTLEMLDAVKDLHGLTSDYQLAKLLDSSTPVISHYRSRKRVMDDYTAARVAELLEIDPLTVIAQANAEREKDSEKRDFWKKLAMTTACVVMTSATLFVALPSNAVAGFSVSEVVQETTKYRGFSDVFLPL